MLYFETASRPDPGLPAESSARRRRSHGHRGQSADRMADRITAPPDARINLRPCWVRRTAYAVKSPLISNTARSDGYANVLNALLARCSPNVAELGSCRADQRNIPHQGTVAACSIANTIARMQQIRSAGSWGKLPSSSHHEAPTSGFRSVSRSIRTRVRTTKDKCRRIWHSGGSDVLPTLASARRLMRPDDLWQHPGLKRDALLARGAAVLLNK